ncbi:histidine kinase [Solitalea lacus]|uniref:histidine kinase n=1 Tax=Solitalea lacus TaxID=2911172 RepID=UPI001EDB2175|nr:histidine kinase [Solitalea lacus]UKJ08601.1 histidine kinase [Solitalea lacus]
MNRAFVIIFLLLLASCQSKPKKENVAPQDLLKKLESINDSIEQNQQIDKLGLWTNQLKQKEFSESSPCLAFINYNIAKNLAKVSTDSAKYHINIALELIEREKEFNALKFTIFNGAGMIAESEGKFYQAVYYFNKSAAIIMNDDLLQSKPLAKVICLLNAAQGNNRIHQYQKAVQQNQLALKFLKKLPNNHYKYYFRAYSQLFTSYVESRSYNADSLRLYLKELRTISSKTHDSIQLRFTNEHTGNYYSLLNQYGTAIPYYKLVKGYDKQSLLANPQKTSAAKNTYTTIANLIDLYVQTKQFSEAAQLINEADELEKQYADWFSFYEKALNKQAKAHYYFAIGNVDEARKTTDKLSELKDNNLKNSGIQATEEMATIYQLQAKDRSINTLNRTIDYTTQRLEKNKLLLFIIGLLALLAVSWALLLYFIQKQRKQKQEREKILLQQQLLRTQMEPHFIFNTLSALQSFIRFDDKEKSIKYLSQFSKLLRSSLELSRQNYVPLNEELEAIENYLSLQQMRFEYTFDYEITKPETDTSTILIPPMLIQPFVENAIIHGIGHRPNDGKISLEIRPNENQLLVKITDNGNGFGKTVNEKVSHQSLSGTIAKERLEILAKESKMNANVDIVSNNQGTCVLLILPIKNL